jgi:hypothetical protein
MIMFSLEGVTRCWSTIINAEKKNNTRNRGTIFYRHYYVWYSSTGEVNLIMFHGRGEKNLISPPSAVPTLVSPCGSSWRVKQW